MSLFKRDREQPVGSTIPPAKQPPPPRVREVRPVAAQGPVAAAQTDPPAQQQPMDVPVLKRDNAAVLDHNTQLTGTLLSEGNVLIEGSFEGEMDAKQMIVVEKDASAEGKLRATDVIVSGTFDGEIICQNRFWVRPGGSITGEINTSILVVEEGSTVNCRFVMSREER